MSETVAVRSRRPAVIFAPRGPTLTLGPRLLSPTETPGRSRFRRWIRQLIGES